MSVFEAVILAIVEGLTEFLPVSSTGHMVITSSLLGIAADEYVKMYTVAIQFGAILSVVAIYRQKFFQSFDFYMKLFVGFIPAAVIGFLCNDYIDALLESPLTVAVSLLLGGIVLLFIDKWFAGNEVKDNAVSAGNILDADQAKPVKEEQVTVKQSFIIGVFQVIAMIPGVSRSAATIIGGLSQKLTRKAAAEFSFFLAVPTMLAATGYKMLKYHKSVGFTSDDMGVLLTGNVVAFVVAFIAIKAFIGFLTKYGFKIFGWYRIIVGLIIIIMLMSGISLSIV